MASSLAVVAGLAGCHFLLSTGAPRDLAAERSIADRPDSSRDRRRPEARVQDSGDARLATACSQGATVQTFTAWQRMVVCHGSGLALTQAQASGVCNAGWHLCTAKEYRARGGTVQVVTSTIIRHTWLAACVLAGQLRDGICQGWLAGCTPSCAIGYPCTAGGGGISRTGYTQWAVVAPHGACYRLGANSADNGAYWFVLDPTYKATDGGAVCCEDP